MKKNERFVFLFLMCFLCGCSSMIIQSDWDTAVDFSRLKTYSWTTQTQERTGDLRIDDSLLDARIRDAVDRELAARGYQKITAGAPDFWVDYHASIRGKLDVTTIQEPYFSAPVVGRHGQIIGGTGWNMWGGSQTFVTQYDEGTLILHIANPATRKLIWRGCLSDVVEPANNPEKRKQKIDRAVKKLLATFPPKA